MRSCQIQSTFATISSFLLHRQHKVDLNKQNFIKSTTIREIIAKCGERHLSIRDSIPFTSYPSIIFKVKNIEMDKRKVILIIYT